MARQKWSACIKKSSIAASPNRLNNAKLDEIDRVRYTLFQLVRYHNISGWMPGDWTDDTDQILCILDSLLEQQVELLNIVRRFHPWAITDGMGRGQTVYSVVYSPDFLQNPHAVAKRIWEASERKAAASGGMMRTSVLGIGKYNSPVKVRRNAEQVCQITHYDPRCVGSCVTVSLAIAGSHAWWRN